MKQSVRNTLLTCAGVVVVGGAVAGGLYYQQNADTGEPVELKTEVIENVQGESDTNTTDININTDTSI